VIFFDINTNLVGQLGKFWPFLNPDSLFFL
jgi:hypothetical protein